VPRGKEESAIKHKKPERPGGKKISLTKKGRGDPKSIGGLLSKKGPYKDQSKEKGHLRSKVFGYYGGGGAGEIGKNPSLKENPTRENRPKKKKRFH